MLVKASLEANDIATSASPELGRRRWPGAAEVLGVELWCFVRSLAGLSGKLARRCVEWWWLSGLGQPESTPATSLAAAGVRARPNSSLRWLWKNGASSYVIYTMR